MANLDDVYDIDNRTAAFENHEHGLLVCLAGPGTGKTYSLLKRTAALIARKWEPDAICYLTFIKEITNAFIGDYIKEFGAESYPDDAPRISTLHSFACRLLRNQGFRMGYDGDLFFANVADNKDDGGDTFLNDLLAVAGQDGCRTLAQMRERVGAIKGSWRDRGEASELPDPTPAILQVSLNLLRCFRLVDWDQTIPLAHEILQELDTAPQWIQKIKHYFVDEYQDFNSVEQALIGLLAADAESIVIVGDDDQSIYSGRGGAPKGILALYGDQQQDRVSLIKCYRCKQNLLNQANTFQASMSGNPRPMTAAHLGGETFCYRFKSSKAEVAFLATYLNTRIAELPATIRSEDGIVCLFPNWRVLNCYFDMLSASVPCARRKTSVAVDRLRLERILQLVQRPHQRFLERLLLNGFIDIKPRHLRMIIDRILERDLAPSAACESLLSENSLTGKAGMAAKAFCDACAAIASQDPVKIAPLIAAAVGVQENTTIAQLRLLIDAGREPTPQEHVISSVCDTLLPDTAAEPEDLRQVLFLTIHSCKGLTKRTVVIPGLEEAWLPGTVGSDEFPERQRLFYVGITRATDNLVLTLPHNRGSGETLNFATPGRGTPSSFIASAGLAASYHA